MSDNGQDRASIQVRRKSRSKPAHDINNLSADHHFLTNSTQGQYPPYLPLILPESLTYIFKSHTEKYFNWTISNLVQFNNKNCFTNLFIVSTGIGIWWSILIISAGNLQKFGFTELESAFICLVYILVGTFGAILIIQAIAKREDLGLKISLGAVLLISAVFF